VGTFACEKSESRRKRKRSPQHFFYQRSKIYNLEDRATFARFFCAAQRKAANGAPLFFYNENIFMALISRNNLLIWQRIGLEINFDSN